MIIATYAWQKIYSIRVDCCQTVVSPCKPPPPRSAAPPPPPPTRAGKVVIGSAVVIGALRVNTLYLRFGSSWGWSGGAMVLGKFPVPERPTIWITVGSGPSALAVGAGGGCLDIFTPIYPFSPLSPSLWETARYRLKYCLKRAVKSKTTNQPI